MKKLNNYFLRFLAIGAVVILNSCGDEETDPVDPPLVTIVSGDFDDVTLTATGQPGDVVSVTFTVSSEAGINAVRMEKTGGVDDGAIPDLFTKTSGADGPVLTDQLTFSYTLKSEEVDAAVTFTIVAVEDTETDQQVTREVLTVETTSPDAKVQTAVIIYVPDTDGYTNTFYSISENQTYSINDVDNSTDPISAGIDLGYFYGSEANLVSPSVYVTFTGLGGTLVGDANDGLPAWGTRNETQLVTTLLTADDLIELTTLDDVETALSDIDFTSAENVLEGLAEGDVYAFETAAGLQGFIRVIAILDGFQVAGPPSFPVTEPNQETVTGNIQLEFILAEAAE